MSSVAAGFVKHFIRRYLTALDNLYTVRLHLPLYYQQVIGGIQRFNAISKVNDMDGARKISSRKCAVYGSGLSRSALLVLAKQHNEFNQIQRTTSFPEIAACCRRLLFSHFAQEAEVDDGDTMPEVPRYNTNAYREFKQECLQFLVSTQVVCGY